MSIIPIITFKAGYCDVDQSGKPYKINPQPKKGYIYLYSEDDLMHFCWRERTTPLDEPELDLVMIPTDGQFVPYDTRSPAESTSKTNGRIFALKFDSSSQRHLFWMQSKPQGRSGDPSWFSPRDLKIGDIVHRLLQGDEVNVNRELAAVRNDNDDSRRDDGDDQAMEDVEGHGDSADHQQGGSGGAGADATGGDIREEGEGSREGGADGARAASSSAPDAAAVVRNFLQSLQGQQGLGGGQPGGGQQAQPNLYPALNGLLDPPTTIPTINEASEEVLDALLSFLPPTILVLSQQGADNDSISAEPSAEAVTAAQEAMSPQQKRGLLEKVLRSPQFTQSLGSLTVALRDGGLPTIAEALGISVENGGLVRGGSVPLGGGDAVEAFVKGVKKTVQGGR